MVHACPQRPRHWRPRCHPCPCDWPPKPDPVPPKPDPKPPVPDDNPKPPIPVPPVPVPVPVPEPKYNVLYLVDQHDVTALRNPADPSLVQRNDLTTLRRRWAWHYQAANLDDFNISDPKPPDCITLHEMIANPTVNPKFKWEGFMFDIPAGDAAVRVGIVADADKASNASLTGPGGAGGVNVDRVVGFAGSYMDNKVPIGTIVQVRRDDQYRRLAASLTTTPKVAFHCAYYVTKATPRQPTGGFRSAPTTDSGGTGSGGTGSGKTGFTGFGLVPDAGPGGPDQPPLDGQGGPDVPPLAEEGIPGQGLLPGTWIPGMPVEGGGAGSATATGAVISGVDAAYDLLMDQNVPDAEPAFANGESWGGIMFGMTTDNLDAGDFNDDSTAPVVGSAIDELEGL